MERLIPGFDPREQWTRSAIAVVSIALLCSACATTPDSGWTPVQAALFNPVQICSEDTNVYGLRLGLPYGKSADVLGIDFGIAGSAKRVTGLQTNLLYNRTENFTGIQNGPFYNQAKDVMGSQLGLFYNGAENVSGTQISWFANQAEDAAGIRVSGMPGNQSTNFSGIEMSVINMADERVNGVQLGMITSHAGDLRGVQISGIHNKSESVVGLQASILVNETEDLKGVQIGVLNFNLNGALPFFPFINIGFGVPSEEVEDSDE